MDSATWCRTPAAASAARRLRPEVSKNSSTALSSNEGELARSITTCAPATASLTPSPVMVLTPLLGEAAMTSWPPWRRMATVFEPIRPVPPMTTIFMVYPPLSMTGHPQMGSTASAADIRASTRVHNAEGTFPNRAGGSLAPEEGQQSGVDLVLVRGREAVRRSWVVDFLCAPDEPGRLSRGVMDRHDLVILAVHNERWHIDLFEVLGEVGFGECLDALVGVLEPGLHAPRPELIKNALRDLCARPV